MPQVPRWLGWTWLVAGGLGIVAGVAFALIAHRLVGSTADSVLESIEVADDVLATITDTTDVIDSAFADIADSLRTVQGTVADGAVTFTQVAKVTSDLGELVGEDVPDSIDAVRDTMPPMIAAAGVIDGAMRALSFVGVDYDVELPLAESLTRLEAELATIPPRLRSQTGLVADVSRRVSEYSGGSLAVAEDLAHVRGRLTESRVLLARYDTTVEEAALVLAELRTALGWQAGLGRWLALVLGLAAAVGQTIPLLAGWWVVKQGRAIE